VFAHYFGNSPVADAFKAALRIPNLLQNLLGEGVLSASFIPVYSASITQENTSNDSVKKSQALASTIACMLVVVATVVALLGVIFAPALIYFITPGFEGERQELAITLVKIFFPGTAILVLSAWCLGVLNSHHNFLLPYSAPVLWNVTIVVVILYFGGLTLNQLAIVTAWGLVAGSLLQLMVQLPKTLNLLGGFKPKLNFNTPEIRKVLVNFFPAFLGRGAIQISAFIDSMIASWLPIGCVATLAYAQTIYLVPVSLFGMSISAAELPSLSKEATDFEHSSTLLRERLSRGLERVLFFVIPSMIGFILLGDVIVATLYQSGRFDRMDTIAVWWVLGCLSIGLVCATQSRLYASVFYALQNTKTPFVFVLIRVALSSILGVVLSLYVPKWFGFPAIYGLVGISLASSLSAIVEHLMLKRAVAKIIGVMDSKLFFILKHTVVATIVAMVALFVYHLLGSEMRPILVGAVVLPIYAGGYLICWYGELRKIRG